MAADIAFRASLGVFGYNANTRNVIVDGGISSALELARMTDENLTASVNSLSRSYGKPDAANPNGPFIRATTLQDLRTYREWLRMRQWEGLPLSPAAFNEAALNATRERMAELELAKASTASMPPTKPAEYKNTDKWMAFFEGFDHYCSRIRGVCNLPIKWIYRKHQEVTPQIRNAAYATNDDRLMAVTIMEGPHFVQDNKMVFDLIKEMTVNNETRWAFVKSFGQTNDGRGAVLALQAQGEGPSESLTRTAAANRIIRDTNWDGPRRNWTFSNFTAKILNAHTELALCGQAMTESAKVQQFLLSIREEMLEGARTHVLGSEELMNDFQKCTTYFAMIRNTKELTTPTDSRRIAGLGDDRGGRGRGRGGRGGRFGRGGGRGRGRGRGGLHAGNYPPSEWQKLTSEEKQRVIDLRKKNKAEKEEREISGAIKDDDEPSKNAGNSFGPNAHKKK